eukprot:1193478-Pleurochrysis_carterae.AAC.1
MRRVLLALREDEAGQVMRYSSQPLHGRTRGDRRPSASSASARVATRPGGNSVAAPTTAVHF